MKMNSYIVSNKEVPPFRQWVDAETPEQAIELFRLRCVADGRPTEGISAVRDIFLTPGKPVDLLEVDFAEWELRCAALQSALKGGANVEGVVKG